MWIILSLLSAFFAAATDPLAKRLLKDNDPYLIGWAQIFLSALFLFPYCHYCGSAQYLPGSFKTILAAIPFEIAALVLYYKSLALTDISLSVPFLALTPVFSVMTGFFILGENVTPGGIAGVLLIMAGAYTINLKHVINGVTKPVSEIFRNRGSLYMVIVALIFSLTTALTKKAMLSSDPESFPFIYNFSVSAAMAPIVMVRLSTPGRRTLKISLSSTVFFLAMGLSLALACVFYYKAVSIANIAYVVSVKRLSLILSVFYGWLFFRERDIHIHLGSTVCMVAGVILIFICN